jgi:hypothetical protein
MNAAFLKKVFASSTFTRDYRNFLCTQSHHLTSNLDSVWTNSSPVLLAEYFDALAMQDNQKKVE